MKKRYLILGFCLIIFLTLSIVAGKDNQKKHRILRHNLWEYAGGEKIFGSFLETSMMNFKENSMEFIYNNDSIKVYKLERQVFSIMVIQDMQAYKRGYYMMKGANWYDYTFGRKSERFK